MTNAILGLGVLSVGGFIAALVHMIITEVRS